MKLPITLAPYASLIKWGIIALLAGFLFVSGCNHGENKSEQRIEQLEQDKTILQDANASWSTAAEERNRQAESSLRESEKLQEEATKSANALSDKREDTSRDVARNQVKLDTAMRDPKCNELLELLVCPTVPLP